MSYTLAMKASFELVGSSRRVCSRCLVVTRIDSNTNYLAVADAGPFKEPLPFSIPLQGILIGSLANSDASGGEVFVLYSSPPDGLQLATKFIPAIGKVVLTRSDSGPSLKGRLHCKNPGFTDDDAQPSSRAWVLSAKYLRWDGELCPNGSAAGPFHG